MILKPHDHNHQHKKSHNPIKKFLDLFNVYFEKLTDKYIGVLEKISHNRFVTVVLLGGFIAGIVALSALVPPGFVPNEDQGMVYAIIQTPPGTTIEKTNDVAQKLQQVAKTVEGVESVAHWPDMKF